MNPPKCSFYAAIAVALACCRLSVLAQDEPILFVTQVPPTAPSNAVVSVSGSHLADTAAAPRGGALMIRYSDGSVRNLTGDAGFGVPTGLQGINSIAVRDPSVHWSGTRALFSMVVGGPTDSADTSEFFWQIFEVTNFGASQTPVITLVQGQPQSFNNIQPA